MTMHKLLLTLFCFFLAAHLHANTLEYTRTATPDSITVGDIVTITLSVQHDKNTQVSPDAMTWPDPFMLQEVQKSASVSGNISTDVWVYKVAIFEPGQHNVPETSLTQLLPNGSSVSHKVPKLPLTVVSILPATTSAIGGIKPLLDIAPTLWPWILGLIVIGGVMGWLWHKRRSKHHENTQPKQPVLSPKEEALHASEMLRAAKTIDAQNYKLACLTMTEILKRFLSRQYHQKMQEMTSSEVIDTLKQLHVPPEDILTIRDFFASCDQIKFAKSPSSIAFCYGLLETVCTHIRNSADPTPKSDSQEKPMS
jgi:hypothetical protein